jgi:hypothetical protein
MRHNIEGTDQQGRLISSAARQLKVKVEEAFEEQLIWSKKYLHLRLEKDSEMLRNENHDLCMQM